MVAHQKSSLAPKRKPIAFELSEVNGFKWLGHYDISIDDLSAVSVVRRNPIWLKALLLTAYPAGSTQQTFAAKAQSLGISKRVLDEAKKTLRVRSVKEVAVWYWQLPEEKEHGPVRLQHCKGAGFSQSCNVLFKRMPIRSLAGQGALFKERLCWGVVRRQRGNAP